ncbi:sucrose-6-phosphate hydrolase [Segniliparus rotundus DSM 44985]|uniref:Sucrose-6-phosphate hydrolase n=1 Tax=Segniliparus rotundus (strain ATCC BAA-972 / CDC 1076 / CIP 108378 / DSM 44985 / JCM 13578) TaxID=640132 RepID=D6ZFH3_SEGRD|nr:glycoside hydrolase family 32 protein [Segniliparus rotundus]ADG97697.1 sucrose-6-phosphate hydrolase [Segniliparus rotundus DSM 44985]
MKKIAMKTALARAEAGVAALASRRRNRWYPQVHIAAKAGWINDPNGLSYFDGRYHVYFQHHPYSAKWGLMHWGHASSADLVTWRHEPIALAPSLKEDRDGVYSGSAVVDGDELVVYYTGNRWLNGVNGDAGSQQVQCVARSKDAITFTKGGVVVSGPPQLADFRDPKVWREGDTWFMVLGVCSTDNRGEVWLYTSADGVAWDFDSVVFRDPDPDAYMLECPDMFPLGDKWVIAYCPMGPKPQGYGLRNGHNAGYVVGEWAPGERFLQLTDFRLADWGGNYYAPQSFEAPDGRRITFGWMGDFDHPVPSQRDSWCGQLTVPRELTLADDLRLRALPVSEFAQLRKATVDLGDVTIGRDKELLLLPRLDAADIELTVSLPDSDAERVGVALRTDTGHEILVAYDDLAKRVLIDRSRAGCGERGYRAAPCSGELLELRVIVDRSSVEVFVGDGSECVSSLAFLGKGVRSAVLFSESGTARFTRTIAHRLRPIW